jgi:hypothetical protein
LQECHRSSFICSAANAAFRSQLGASLERPVDSRAQFYCILQAGLEQKHRPPVTGSNPSHCFRSACIDRFRGAELNRQKSGKPTVNRKTPLMLGDPFNCEDPQLPVSIADFPSGQIIRRAVGGRRLV